ncbi:MAG TPA: LLM class flavin-dependent oxidoreductase, partial [Acidimicrobiales bacterium]|nr:LLM class flavin-dependent oxidoreductase [Acidimicrobiales bacterium]
PGEELGAMVADMEELGFDSIWLPEILSAPAGDPLMGLAFAAAAVKKLKLGTTMVLPGRNPVRLAKQLATLDRLSGGRLLTTFVLGLAQPGELAALDVAKGGRGAMVDEALPLLRRLWSEDEVTHRGRWNLDGLTVEPKPLQQPLEAWLGGIARSTCERVGALADGWLPAMCTPEEAGRGRVVVEEAAARAGRVVDPEHFGVSIGYLDKPPSPDQSAALARRLARRGRSMPEVPLEDLVPAGLDALAELIGRYLEAGFSKFVVRPIAAPASWRAELEALAERVLVLQR